MIKLHQDTTESLVNVLRNGGKYVHADYMQAMANRIAALEAERDAARQLVDDLAEEVWHDAEPDGSYTIFDADMIGQTPEYQQQHKELLRRVNAALRNAPQPEPEAEAVDDIDRLEEAQNAGNAGFLAD